MLQARVDQDELVKALYQEIDQRDTRIAELAQGAPDLRDSQMYGNPFRGDEERDQRGKILQLENTITYLEQENAKLREMNSHARSEHDDFVANL